MSTSLGRRRETTDVSILLNLKAGARKLTQEATGAPHRAPRGPRRETTDVWSPSASEVTQEQAAGPGGTSLLEQRLL